MISPSPFNNSEKSKVYARQILYTQFDQLHRRARLIDFWSKLWRNDRHLQELSEAKKSTQSKSGNAAGIQLVSINRINGSEGRSQDFDAEFRPLKKFNRERWLGVATERYMGNSLPPVTLVRLGCSYFVRDGHHRISVAKTLGQREIEAEVMLWDAKSDEVCEASGEV